jgi:hypothetical protein
LKLDSAVLLSYSSFPTPPLLLLLLLFLHKSFSTSSEVSNVFKTDGGKDGVQDRWGKKTETKAALSRKRQSQ